jgi:hypothetical protein
LLAKKLKTLTQKAVAELCLMDDVFMSKFFENNIPDTEYLLRTILENDKIVVLEIHIQYQIKNLQGHSLKLDIFAQDEHGRYFNVEVQRADKGALPKRARYHASLLDANILPIGEPFSELHPTYIIFITEHDVLGYGLPIYHIHRKIEENNALFDDEAHIIFVNGECRHEKSPLSLLMHDFFCKNPEEMYNQQYAKRADRLKNGEGGTKEMPGAWDLLINEINKDAEIQIQEIKNNITVAMLNNHEPFEKIIAYTGLKREEIEKLQRQLEKHKSA